MGGPVALAATRRERVRYPVESPEEPIYLVNGAEGRLLNPHKEASLDLCMSLATWLPLPRRTRLPEFSQAPSPSLSNRQTPLYRPVDCRAYPRVVILGLYCTPYIGLLVRRRETKRDGESTSTSPCWIQNVDPFIRPRFRPPVERSRLELCLLATRALWGATRRSKS